MTILINGFAIPAARDQVRELDLSVKSEIRTPSGDFVRDVRHVKRGWQLMTRLMPIAEARALKAMILGRGHVWSFDGSSAYSSKGLAVTGAYTMSASGGAFGGYLTGATGGALISGLTAYTAWTTAQWIYTGSAWEHRLQTSAGLKYTNGAPTPGASWSYPITSGAYAIASGVQIDDLVILPYALPAALCAQWSQTLPFGPLPQLTLTGDLIDEDSLLVEGMDQAEIAATHAAIDGVWQQVGTLSLALAES